MSTRQNWDGLSPIERDRVSLVHLLLDVDDSSHEDDPPECCLTCAHLERYEQEILPKRAAAGEAV